MTGKRTKTTGSAPPRESARNPSKQTRERVAVAAGGGMPESDIACALGIELSTLRRVFRAELSTGAFEKRVGLIQAMYSAAMKGNTAAAKAYLSLQPMTAAPPARELKPKRSRKDKASSDPQPLPTDEPAPVRPVKLGKKEQQKAAAKTAQTGSAWATVLPNHARPQ